MKKLLIVSALTLALLPAKSQTRQTTTTTQSSQNNGYNNGTSTTTTTTTTDQVYQDHWGPQGETVYMTHNKKYYYKDKGGKKHYGKENSFKTKEKSK